MQRLGLFDGLPQLLNLEVHSKVQNLQPYVSRPLELPNIKFVYSAGEIKVLIKEAMGLFIRRL